MPTTQGTLYAFERHANLPASPYSAINLIYLNKICFGSTCGFP
jgi:hypothetical protein